MAKYTYKGAGEGYAIDAVICVREREKYHFLK
jgi:hypothetical protein